MSLASGWFLYNMRSAIALTENLLLLEAYLNTFLSFLMDAPQALILLTSVRLELGQEVFSQAVSR